VSRRTFVCIVISLLALTPARGDPPAGISSAGKAPATGAKPAGSAVDATTPEQAAAEIDRRLAEELFAHLPAGQTVAPPASDDLLLRRLFLDLSGRPPKPHDVRTFLDRVARLPAGPEHDRVMAEQGAKKRAEFIAALVDSPQFGVHLANYWRDVILARQNSVGEGPIMPAESLERFLTEQFNGNVPWDAVVRKFVEANGPVNDHGETAVYIAQRVDTADVAGEMSRLFLGIQIQCAQCHDHPTDRWKRNQFHEFAAFFPRAGVKRYERKPGARPEPQIGPYDDGPMERTQRTRFVGLREHVMTDLKKPNEPGKIVTPAFFLNGKKLAAESSDADRRAALARWMTAPENPWFARAFVNRAWAELVGEGFYEPVDDLGPDRQATAPKTLDYLVGEFIAHGHDVKWLYRTIVHTEAYRRESRPRRKPGEVPMTANVSQPLRADQLRAVLGHAAGVDLFGPRAAVEGPGKSTLEQRSPLHRLFQFDPAARRSEVSGSIPQALMLMNLETLNEAVSARSADSKLAKLLAAETDDAAAVEELYLLTLARKPSERETAICLTHVKSVGERAEAFEDLFWSLLNSEEIRFRN
jgi:hypothetical protein